MKNRTLYQREEPGNYLSIVQRPLFKLKLLPKWYVGRDTTRKTRSFWIGFWEIIQVQKN